MSDRILLWHLFSYRGSPLNKIIGTNWYADLDLDPINPANISHQQQYRPRLVAFNRISIKLNQLTIFISDFSSRHLMSMLRLIKIGNVRCILFFVVNIVPSSGPCPLHHHHERSPGSSTSVTVWFYFEILFAHGCLLLIIGLHCLLMVAGCL